MALGDGDVQNGLFFQDGDAGVLADGSVLMGHFDLVEQLDSFGGQKSITGEMGGKPVFRYSSAQADALGGLKHGTVITIKDVKYKVRTAKKIEDGQISVAELANA